MRGLIDLGFKGLEGLLVLLLAAMVVMVFGNVVLRYLFDTGIDVSEELSRFLFVWLTFIGAVVVARENAHLGVETLVTRLGAGGRKLCMVLSDVVIIACCAVFFWGTWQQAGINATNYAPITEISMLWIYGVGFFTSIGMGLMALARILRVVTGRIDEHELKAFAGEYGDDEAHALKERLE
ncbi:TRAP transporter small permease [Chelatococcus sp. SYSU_G07232]|uniref:TRAP transporter small permease protein n=1 Tax=Chelatococcus albus TaxID=3047466 RepID=A0ABT7AIG5_9HYPH|nr:TRAP transporter small permease [Chelatococcus sp. SYSU_G07232]MDJ1159171.1 TRAP transporter small permease [Chelatococcus sp. SYSU_G07232]